MRLALLILVTLIASFNASWLLWRDRLTPTTLITPTPMTALQRQYGQRMRAPLAAALERPLPHDFETGRSLRLTLERLGEVTGARIVVNYPSLNRLGGVDERAPLTTPLKLGGRPLRDALPALLASVPSRD